MGISVIIPAHNEATVIERSLRALLDGVAPGEMHIWVVANGCGDATAEKARAFGPDVSVIETSVASKSNALNLGDAAADGFPRFYVDADVVINSKALRVVAGVLSPTGVLAAAPLMRVDCTDCPWSVRAYYAVWLKLPYCRNGMIGSGVYALSEEGRKRFDHFPDITADDAFVRLQFSADERKTVEDCTFTVTPPRNLAGIIDIKTRSHFGSMELKRYAPQLSRNEGDPHTEALLRLALNPTWWPSLAVYLYVKIATRLCARRRLRRGEFKLWERDDTSRQVSPTPPGI